MLFGIRVRNIAVIQLDKLSNCIFIVKLLCMLLTRGQKIRCNFVGPSGIWKCLGPTQTRMPIGGKLFISKHVNVWNTLSFDYGSNSYGRWSICEARFGVCSKWRKLEDDESPHIFKLYMWKTWYVPCCFKLPYLSVNYEKRQYWTALSITPMSVSACFV